MKAVLIRLVAKEKQTLGVFQLFDNETKVFECKTLELPWLENKKKTSCIPAWIYDVAKHKSPKFGDVFMINNVINRSAILIHKGNYNQDTRGCILVGTNYNDINKDGAMDIAGSAIAMERLLKIAPDNFKLTIV